MRLFPLAPQRWPDRLYPAAITSLCSQALLALAPAVASAQETAQEAAPGELSTTTAFLEQEVERILEQTGIPSISIALIQEGRVVWAEAFGYANVGARVPATADTYYSTGSTFKFVTATAVMQLVERGDLTLDTPLNELVDPELAVEGADDVTVRHLLSHHSGLDAFALARRINFEGPASTVPLWSRRDHITIEHLLANTRRSGPPGVVFEYSNDGYAILGYIVEQASRRSFDRYVARNVLQPLGIDIDRPSVPSPRVVEHLALPYELDGAEPRPIAQVRYDGYAAGDIYLKASDMARFVAAHLNGGEYEGERILSAASTLEMRRPQFGGRPYGLGVRTASFSGHDLITHTGSIPGFHSTLVAEPASRQGVYLMANAQGAQDALGVLARHAMQLMWGDDVELLASPAPRVAVAVSSDLLEEYVGEYAFRPDESFTVSREGSQLWVQPTEQPRLEVFASSDTDFFLRRGQATLTFGRDAEGGPVTHLVLHKVRGDRRASRVR